MTNAELIYNLRYCFEKRKTVVGVPWYVWCDRAADAIQTLCDELATYHAKSVTDDKRIAELNTKCADLQSQINSMENEIEELLPKECEFKRNARRIPNARNRYCTQCGAYLSDEEYENHTVRYCYYCGSKVKGEQESER